MFPFMPIPPACLLNFFICALKFSMLSVYFPTSWDDASEIESMYDFFHIAIDFE